VVGFLLTAAGTLADFQVLSNSLRSWSKAVPGGVTDGQFSGLLHFATLGTSAGWELLCRMTKVTSEQFRYGGIDNQIFECREIRSKTGSKSRPKTGPDQQPKSRKHPYTGKSRLQSTSKWGPKWRSKTALKWWSKVRPKSRPRRRGPHRIFVKRGLA